MINRPKDGVEGWYIGNYAGSKGWLTVQYWSAKEQDWCTTVNPECVNDYAFEPLYRLRIDETDGVELMVALENLKEKQRREAE